jgi:cation transport ATPase
MTREKKEQIQQLRKLVIDTVKEKKPNTVEDLIKTIQQQNPYTREVIIQSITTLNNEGKIIFKDNRTIFCNSFQTCLFSKECTWFWALTITTLIATAAIVTIQENAFPLAYVRYAFGSLFVLFLPGYSFLKATFIKKELEHLEEAILGVVLSITFVILTSLFLNFTPLGITLGPLVFVLSTMTLLFSITAVYRMYLKEKPAT